MREQPNERMNADQESGANTRVSPAFLAGYARRSPAMSKFLLF